GQKYEAKERSILTSHDPRLAKIEEVSGESHSSNGAAEKFSTPRTGRTITSSKSMNVSAATASNFNDDGDDLFYDARSEPTSARINSLGTLVAAKLKEEIHGSLCYPSSGFTCLEYWSSFSHTPYCR